MPAGAVRWVAAAVLLLSVGLTVWVILSGGRGGGDGDEPQAAGDVIDHLIDCLLQRHSDQIGAGGGKCIAHLRFFPLQCPEPGNDRSGRDAFRGEMQQSQVD